MTKKVSNLAKQALLISSLCIVFTVFGSEESSEEAIPVRYEKPAHISSCPNAFYETIGGYLNIKHVSVPHERSLKLSVPGFAGDVPVKAVIQDHPAPLVVVLLGVGGTTNSDYSRLWPRWFAESGYNVLFFDSTFKPEMADLINRGPSGNLWSETEAVRDIISAFLAREGDRITKIGVVGMSYGGIEALILGEMETEGKLPFHLAAIQAYSPPIDLEKTARILDHWYDCFRWSYTLIQLNREVGGYDFRQDDCCNTLSEPEMKAAIAVSFHEELTPVVTRENSQYCLNLLPRGDEFNDRYVRGRYASKWGFQDYMYKLALPYWQGQLGPSAVDRLINDTRLFNLLRSQPRSTEVVIAENDPFDEAGDLDALRSFKAPARVTLIPQGGHLGYAGDDWTRDKLLGLFERS